MVLSITKALSLILIMFVWSIIIPLPTCLDSVERYRHERLQLGLNPVCVILSRLCDTLEVMDVQLSRRRDTFIF